MLRQVMIIKLYSHFTSSPSTLSHQPACLIWFLYTALHLIMNVNQNQHSFELADIDKKIRKKKLDTKGQDKIFVPLFLKP